MRLMSFAMTTQQYLDFTKRVTRRLGWEDLKPGETFMGIEKGQGLKKGQTVTRLGAAMCVSNRREPLNAITPEEVALEGFPGMSPEDFIAMFCRANRCEPDQEISRIEFCRYADQPEAVDV